MRRLRRDVPRAPMFQKLVVIFGYCSSLLVAATAFQHPSGRGSQLSLGSGRKLRDADNDCEGKIGPSGHALDELCDEIIRPWYIKPGHPNDGNEGDEGNEGGEGADEETPISSAAPSDPEPAAPPPTPPAAPPTPTPGPVVLPAQATACNGKTTGPNGHPLDELCHEIVRPWYRRAGHPNDGNEGNEGNEGAHEEHYFAEPPAPTPGPTENSGPPPNVPIDPTPAAPPTPAPVPVVLPAQATECYGKTTGPNGHPLDELCHEIVRPWYRRAGHPNDGNEGNEGNEGAHEEHYFAEPPAPTPSPY